MVEWSVWSWAHSFCTTKLVATSVVARTIRILPCAAMRGRRTQDLDSDQCQGGTGSGNVLPGCCPATPNRDACRERSGITLGPADHHHGARAGVAAGEGIAVLGGDESPDLE